MSIETFRPPRPPAVGSTRAVSTRTLEASFGDGYSQRSGDGLNAIGREAQLSWPVLLKDQADEIEAFFTVRRGFEAFWWTPPQDWTPRKWTCKSWTREPRGGRLAALSAVFEEVFDLE